MSECTGTSYNYNSISRHSYIATQISEYTATSYNYTEESKAMRNERNVTEYSYSYPGRGHIKSCG